MHSRAGERRKNPRFDIHFRANLRVFGNPWTRSETTEISATGASFITNRPFLLSTPVEYVLTLPPELTKAARNIRVRFYASVLRCERVTSGEGTFAVAVRNTGHRYLSPEEAAVFDELDKKPEPTDHRATDDSDRKTGT
jgi:PilZ domain-containing protein